MSETSQESELDPAPAVLDSVATAEDADYSLRNCLRRVISIDHASNNFD